jgi:hypothetical protein
VRDNLETLRLVEQAYAAAAADRNGTTDGGGRP